MKKVELLAPAGNFSKLKTALAYGADGVYAGGKNFSLRSFAGNFDGGEIAEAVKYTHALGKNIYITANIFAKNADFGAAKEYFEFLKSISVDGVIITDPGFIELAKRVGGLRLHLSTQANTLNKYAVKFWQGQGIERIVLARELSIAEIKEIKDFVPDMELEAFIHGAMCISYSGRCLLSNYLADRDSNRGECVQACRWEYELREKNKGGDFLGLEEDSRGVYILNSKDLNMSAKLWDLYSAGITSFKIEGRMKSEYYVATAVNAYRRAIDILYREKENYKLPVELEQELLKAAHREYTTAYSDGKNLDTESYNGTQTPGTYEFIALVKGYDKKSGCIIAEMRNRFKKGDVLEILSPDGYFNKSFTVDRMFGADGNQTEDAKLVQEILKIQCPYNLTEGTILRKKL